MSKIGTLKSVTRKWMPPTICFSLDVLGFSGWWLSEGHFVFVVSLTLSFSRREWDLDIQEKIWAARRAFSLVMGETSKCLLSCLGGFCVVSSADSSYFPIILFKEAGPGGKKKAEAVASCRVTPGSVPPPPVTGMWPVTAQRCCCESTHGHSPASSGTSPSHFFSVSAACAQLLMTPWWQECMSCCLEKFFSH